MVPSPPDDRFIGIKTEHAIDTPAKINFSLNILKRRADGYHELLMDIVPISLFDRIVFTPTRTEGIEATSPDMPIRWEDNLVCKAIRLLEKESDRKFAMRVRLDKTIPVGAGLGGGSGNAAGTLVALNRLFDLGFSVDGLKKLASKLGADVPFFIAPAPAIAEGIGDRLRKLPPLRTMQLLILYPGFSIATPEAYSQCTVSGRTDRFNDYSIGGFRHHSVDGNDFWPTLKNRYPELVRARNALLAQKAVAAGLSGSGSALYALFPDANSRDRAYRCLCPHPKWQLFPCQTLSSHTY